MFTGVHIGLKPENNVCLFLFLSLSLSLSPTFSYNPLADTFAARITGIIRRKKSESSLCALHRVAKSYFHAPLEVVKPKVRGGSRLSPEREKERESSEPSRVSFSTLLTRTYDIPFFIAATKKRYKKKRCEKKGKEKFIGHSPRKEKRI